MFQEPYYDDPDINRKKEVKTTSSRIVKELDIQNLKIFKNPLEDIQCNGTKRRSGHRSLRECYQNYKCSDSDDDTDEKDSDLNEIREKCSKSNSNRSKLSSSVDCEETLKYFGNLSTRRQCPTINDDIKISSMFPNVSTETSHEISFAVFIGMVLGVLFSKVVTYLELYFAWILKQILKMANIFLRDKTPSEFLNFDDTTYYSPRTKLLLSPILALLAFLYGIVYIMQYFFRLMLSQTPDCLLSFVVDRDYF